MLPTAAVSRCRSARRNPPGRADAPDLGERPVLVVRSSSVRIEGRRSKPRCGSVGRAVPDLRSKALGALGRGEDPGPMKISAESSWCSCRAMFSAAAIIATSSSAHSLTAEAASCIPPGRCASGARKSPIRTRSRRSSAWVSSAGSGLFQRFIAPLLRFRSKEPPREQGGGKPLVSAVVTPSVEEGPRGSLRRPSPWSPWSVQAPRAGGRAWSFRRSRRSRPRRRRAPLLCRRKTDRRTPGSTSQLCADGGCIASACESLRAMNDVPVESAHDSASTW